MAEPGSFKGKLAGKLFFLTVAILCIEMGFLIVLALELKKNIPQLILIAFAGVIFLAVALQVLLRKAVIKPLGKVVEATKKVSEGDLTTMIKINSGDEFTYIERAINRIIENFGELVRKVKTSAVNVSIASGQIGLNSKRMAEGARSQVEAVEKTTSSVEELNFSIREIANSVSTLSTSADETSSSVLEIGSSIEEVAENTFRLSDTISETLASIEEMVASARELARSAEFLEETISETGAATLEINAAIGTVVDNTKESARLAEKVLIDASEFGMLSIVDAIDGTDRVRDSVKKAGDSVNRLKERSLEINKIVAVIDAVTSRTNLLALNAAILAAQAGEHGKSFSVVAEEIRELAEKTSASTKEISDLIVTIQQETQDTVDIMKEGLIRVDDGNKLVYAVGDALRTIIHSSQQSQVAAKGIEGAAVEQARGVKQVTESVERVKDMIVNIANAIRELRNGTGQIVKAMEVVDSISKHVKKAMEDQASGSRQIGSVVESTVEKTRLISKATEEQKIGTESILQSIDEVKTVAVEGMDIASEIDLAMNGIRKDAEDLKRVVEVFKVK